MKSITLDYYTYERKTFTIPTEGKWYNYFKAFFKDDDERTRQDWNFLDKYSLEDFVKLRTGKKVTDIEIFDYK